MATSNLILQSYFKTATYGKKDKGSYNKRAYNKKVKELLELSEGDFLTPLNYYLDILENTDPVLFPYMNTPKNALKKEQLLRDLQVTLLLLLTQRKYEQQYQKTENFKTYNSQIKKCCELIHALQYEKVCKEKNIRPSPEHGYATDGEPVKYLALSWGQWFAQHMVDFWDRKTKTIKDVMGSFNEKRLYWVWGSVLLKTTLELLPANFFNLNQAKETIRYPDPYTGTISWALYYFRFGLNLGLLLKHTIAGPWMEKKEKNKLWTERFLTEWSQRKFTLLNDSVWATGNLVCFFWLTGAGALGTAGDALTLALLVFDIGLAVKEFMEEQTKYNKEMLNYEETIAQLKEQIEKTKKNKAVADEEYNKKMMELSIQLYALERAQKQCKNDWEYKKLGLIINISYAVGLMLAFFLLAAPFPALAFLGPVGAVLCFALTVINNAIKGGLEIYKTNQTIKDIKEDIKHKIAEFNQLAQNPDTNENEKKFLFLEIKKLMADSDYQRQVANLQTAQLIRSIIFETFVPAVILINLLFCPIAVIPIVCGIVALAICTYLIINAVFKPEKEMLKPFNEREYQAFCDNPDSWSNKPVKSQAFFPIAEKPTLDKTAPDKEEELDENLDLSLLFGETGFSG